MGTKKRRQRTLYKVISVHNKAKGRWIQRYSRKERRTAWIYQPPIPIKNGCVRVEAVFQRGNSFWTTHTDIPKDVCKSRLAKAD